MTIDERSGTSRTPIGNRALRLAASALAAVAMLAATASATITVTDYPDGLVRLDEEVVISWAETINGNLRYGRAPGTYTDETAAQGWGSLAFYPMSEGMTHGVYYCVIGEVGGGEVSEEFTLIVDSPVFPTPTAPPNGSTVTETTTGLSWDPVDQVPYYHVMVSDHEIDVEQQDGELVVTGANIIWQAITGSTSIQFGSTDPSGFFVDSNGTSPPLMSEFSYHWLVLNNYGNNPLLSSNAGAGLSAFDVDVPVSMAAPALTSPPDSVLITEETMDFSWTPVAGASGYHLYIYEARDWGQAQASFPIWDGPAPTPAAQVAVGGFMTPGSFSWRVVALDSSGAGIASETRAFEYVTETGTARIRTRKENDDPLPNVLIEIELLAGGGQVLPGVTDGAGVLDRELKPGEYLIRATKPDYVDTTATVVIAVDEDPPVHIVMRKASARMRGLVEDEIGQPVFNADVVAVSGDDILEAESDASGNFVIQASAGTWSVHAEKPGFAPSDPVVVELHADDYVELASPLTIVGTPGTVTGNVVNVAGGPVSGADVHALSSFGSASTTTDAGGHFSLELAPGSWTVRAEKSGFLPGDGRELPVYAGGNTQVEPPLLLVPAGSAVMGRVTNGRTAIADARVVAVPTHGQAVEETTNGYGEFTMLLPAGVYDLVAHFDGYVHHEPHQVDVRQGESYLGVELPMAPANCVIEGTVLDGSGPVDGAVVAAGLNEAFTAFDGSFSLGVSGGLHELKASKSGYLSGEPVLVGVTAGQTLCGIEFKLTGGASTISGNVAHDGATVPGALVTAVSGGKTAAAAADENGGYELCVEAGQWTVSAAGHGFAPSGSENVIVADGQSAVGVDLEVDDIGATLLGAVTDSRGSVPGATVLAFADGAQRPVLRTSANADGSYALRVAPGTAHTLVVSADEHAGSTIEIAALTEGETRVVGANLDVRTGHIAGVVTGAGGAPLAGAHVETPSTGPPAVTDWNGDFELWVDPGYIDVTVNRPGYSESVFAGVQVLDGHTTELDCVLADALASLEGTVSDSLTGDPIEGVLVSAVWDEGASDVTGADGGYELPAVVSGDVGVVFTKNGFLGKQTAVVLAPSEAMTLDANLLRLTGSIAGTVTDSGAGLPVAGVSVRATVGDDVVSAAVTAPDGRYALTGLDPAETYSVFASRAGYSSDSENPLTGITPDALDVDFILRLCDGTIAGTVTDGGDGQPVFGASVTADNGLGHFGSAMTGLDGTFLIEGLASVGTYDVTAGLYGYLDATAEGVTPGGDPLELQLPRNFGGLSGTLAAQGPDVVFEETTVAATNIAFASYSRTDTPDGLGTYEITDIRPGSYVVSVSGGTHLGTPAQVSVQIGEGETVSGLDFTVEKATIQRIDVVGPGEVRAGGVAVFSGSVFADDERLVNTDLEWWIAPACAGAVDRATGTVSVSSGYIGEMAVSARESSSGQTGRAETDVYITVSPDLRVTATDSLGMTLDVGPGAVTEAKSIYLAHEALPDVMRYSEGYVVAPESYHFKPCGMVFDSENKPVLSVPAHSGDDLLRWDHDYLTWELMDSERSGTALETWLSELGEYAVSSRSDALGVSDITAEPNPFSPDVGPVTLSYELSSDTSRMPFVTVRVYNMAAQLVREIVSNEPQGKGTVTLEWDGLTDSNETARNGRYVIEVVAEDASGSETALGTVVLVK